MKSLFVTSSIGCLWQEIGTFDIFRTGYIQVQCSTVAYHKTVEQIPVSTLM